MSSVLLGADFRERLLPFREFPDCGPDDNSLFLRAAYEKFELPDQQHNSTANRKKFGVALTAWERHWAQLAARDPAQREPAIGEIDTTHLRRFRDWLRVRAASKTTNVYCSYVRQILRKCGPPDSRNPEGQRVLREVPYIRSIPMPRSLPEIVWLQQLGPWYEACRVATWPASGAIPPPLWWRCLLVLCFSYGFRTADVVQIGRTERSSNRSRQKPQGMDWSSILDAAECPIPAIPFSHQLGWIYLRPGKTQRHKPELVLPMTSVVAKHLSALPRHRASNGDRRLVLPSPACSASFRKQNEQIQTAAGIKPRIDKRGRLRAMTPQMLRRSCKSYWTRLSPEVSRYIGGWSPRTVDEQFYLQPIAALLEPDEHGQRLIDRFRYPEAFLNGP
jgi:hypothetical protein